MQSFYCLAGMQITGVNFSFENAFFILNFICQIFILMKDLNHASDDKAWNNLLIFTINFFRLDFSETINVV